MSEVEEQAEPKLSLEMQYRMAFCDAQVQIAKLNYQNAELRMVVADKIAALESDRLTREQDEIAGLVNTSFWRYDFEQKKFVKRGA